MFIYQICWMELDFFWVLVALIAIIYSGVTFFIQNKVVDRKKVEAIQEESKLISKELSDAQKSGDQKRIDEAVKRQYEFMPRFNELMVAQLKPMVFIIAALLIFTNAIGYLDPFVKDDKIVGNFSDLGGICDRIAGDGIYTSCFTMDKTQFGVYDKSVIHIYSYSNETSFFIFPSQGQSHNSTEIILNGAQVDELVEGGWGPDPATNISQKVAEENGKIKVEVTAEFKKPVNKAEVEFDSGTTFGVTLPFEIPILGVKRIYRPYWWFIFVSIISNLFIGQAYKIATKKKETNEVPK